MPTKLSALTAITTIATTDEVYLRQGSGFGRLALSESDGGFAGGRTRYGGTGAGEHFVVQTTENATRGQFRVGTVIALDESTGRIGAGTLSPQERLHLEGATPGIRLWDTGGAANAKGWLFRNSAGTLIMRPLLDTGGIGTNVWELLRTADEIDEMRVGNPTATSSTLRADIANGRIVFKLPGADPGAGILGNSQAVIYEDNAGNAFIRWKTAAGVSNNKQMTP